MFYKGLSEQDRWEVWFHRRPIFSLNSVNLTGYTLTMGIYSLKNPSNSRQISTLVDTGALKANFVSEDVAQWLTSHGDSTERVESKRRCQVCSVNECTMADRIIAFKLEYFNKNIQQCQQITSTAWV